MKRNSKISAIGELLNNSMFDNIGVKNRMTNVIKHSTIFSFWNDIVGVKFARHTKPYAIKGNKLYISVKSPVIGQELSLYKLRLLKKVNSYSIPLGTKITDIVFNYKNYKPLKTPSSADFREDIPINLDKDYLSAVFLNDEIKKEFREKIDKIEFLNDFQKENLLNKLINAKKANIIQKNNPNLLSHPLEQL